MTRSTAATALLLTIWVSAAMATDPAAERGWPAETAESAWQAEPWLVRDPDPQSSIEPGPDGTASATFHVKAGGPEMAWTWTTNPAWVTDAPWVEVAYEGQAAEAVLVFSDDSTGPVTPGALNPENPLASGGELQLRLPTTERRLVQDLRNGYRSDRIARITLRLRGDTQATRFTIRHLVFWSRDPRGPSTRPAPTATPQPTPVPGDGQWLSIDLTQAGAVPLQTSIPDTVSIALTGRWRGRELALSLATRLVGNDSPWPGAKPTRPDRPVRSAHELRVRLQYDDGTEVTALPFSTARQEWSVGRNPEIYRVAIDPGRSLVRVDLEESLSYGSLSLPGAWIRVDGPPSQPRAAPRTDAIPPTTRPMVEHGVATPSITHDGGTIEICNARLDLQAITRDGLRVESLAIGQPRRPFNREPFELLELLTDAGERIPLKQAGVEVRSGSGTTSAELSWTSTNPSVRAELRLRVDVSGDGPVRLTPTIRSRSEGPLRLGFTCPALAGTISDDPQDRGYLLGTRGAILDHRPIQIDQPWSGAFPLQLMDVFSAGSGDGVAAIGTDNGHLLPRRLRFVQDASSTRFSIVFPQLDLAPQTEVTLPALELLPHAGDWHAALQRYREVARGEERLQPGDRMRDVFYCRRDYPLGGTGYLYDTLAKMYTPQRLIDESNRGFGGIDLVDISGWAYREETGRVGDYLDNDLGGLVGLQRGIDQARALRTPVGLYFEGYLIDRRAPLATRALPAWQIIRRDGKPAWWSGEMEFFACPGVAEWRQELSTRIAEVAARTGAGAVYVDEFGFADPGKACWSPDHGHPVPSNPLVEESRMLHAIRTALDGAGATGTQTGIYIEQAPCDALVPLIDGAFDYEASAGAPGSVGQRHITGLPLVRYVFPELAHVAMVSYGIRPVPVEEDELHRCIFHGRSIWLKGRADSWYTPGFRETARRAYRILHENVAAFRSRDCEPLIPTLHRDLYANRFAAGKRSVVTFYNAGPATIEGDLLELPMTGKMIVHDLWYDRTAETAQTDGAVTLKGRVEPHSVGVFRIEAAASNHADPPAPIRP